MKSERRHELQTNTLADWIGRQSEAVKPHVNLILTVILAAVAVLLAWVYFRQWNASQRTAAWTDYYQAAGEADPATLVEMAERHAGERPSVWALLLAADQYLAEGAGQAFSDRKQAETSLKQAVRTYEAVLEENVHGREPLLRRRALFGLAEAHETLFAVTADKPDLEKAREYYQRVAQQWPETVLGRTAEKKAGELAQESTRDFLVWFSKQEPVAADQQGLHGGLGLEEPAGDDTPFDLSTLPGADELLLPEETAPEVEVQPPVEKKAPTESDTPAEDDAAAEGKTPAEPANPEETGAQEDENAKEPPASSETDANAPSPAEPKADKSAP